PGSVELLVGLLRPHHRPPSGASETSSRPERRRRVRGTDVAEETRPRCVICIAPGPSFRPVPSSWSCSGCSWRPGRPRGPTGRRPPPLAPPIPRYLFPYAVALAVVSPLALVSDAGGTIVALATLGTFYFVWHFFERLPHAVPADAGWVYAALPAV